MKTIVFCISMFLAVSAMAQESVVLRLTVKNVKNQNGKLRATIFQGESAYLKQAKFTKEVAISSQGEVVLVFDKVPIGEYAISIYHDENNNDEMDMNLLGIPTESYGFSNDAPSRFGPPNYTEVKFIVSEVNNEQLITLN